MKSQWIAERWSCHAATTVTTLVNGKRRTVAECDTEEEAQLIATAPQLLEALQLAAHLFPELLLIDEVRQPLEAATGKPTPDPIAMMRMQAIAKRFAEASNAVA